MISFGGFLSYNQGQKAWEEDQNKELAGTVPPIEEGREFGV